MAQLLLNIFGTPFLKNSQVRVRVRVRDRVFLLGEGVPPGERGRWSHVGRRERNATDERESERVENEYERARERER